jgi:hypothetical protein
MGTDPQFFTRPRTMAIARAAARGRPDERCTHQAVPRRPRSRTEELASAGGGRHRLAVGLREPRRHRWLTGSSRDMPSSATVASAIARRRERPARGVKAGPVPSQASCETIATPHAYTGRASRSRRARLRKLRARVDDLALREPDDRARRWGWLGALDEALKRLCQTLAAASFDELARAQGVHVTAQRAVAARQRLVERTPADGHADAERQKGVVRSLRRALRRISLAPSVQLPVSVTALRFAPPSLMAPSSGTRTRSRMGRGVHCGLARDFAVTT